MDAQYYIQRLVSSARSDETHSKVAEALARLGVCVRSVGLYGRSHPIIDEMANAAREAVAKVLSVSPTVVVAVTESYLVMDNFPIEDTSGCLAALAKLLYDKKIGELEITAGITRDDVIEFSEALSLRTEDHAPKGGIGRELRKRKVEHIRVRTGPLPAESRPGKDPADVYEEALLLVEDAMRAVQSGIQIPVPEIRAVVAQSLHSLTEDERALLALAGIKSYDRYLSEHSVNVCILSMLLGRDLGLDGPATLELGLSAMLHDVGKVFVPGNVVKKPGKLTEEEWEQIRRHPVEGARALAGVPGLPLLASTVAIEHHVRCDGSGYPSFPTQVTPHLLSRLVAIVDTYDALTTDRPYRERWTGQQAIAWMLYEGWRHYDRQLMARFASRARLYPLGSMVRLVGGHVAVVVSGSYKHPTRPTLKIVAPSGGRKASEEIVDLSANTDPALEINTMAQPVEVLLPYVDQLAAA